VLGGAAVHVSQCFGVLGHHVFLQVLKARKYFYSRISSLNRNAKDSTSISDLLFVD
jgi:hypothetical protein